MFVCVQKPKAQEFRVHPDLWKALNKHESHSFYVPEIRGPVNLTTFWSHWHALRNITLTLFLKPSMDGKTRACADDFEVSDPKKPCTLLTVERVEAIFDSFANHLGLDDTSASNLKDQVDEVPTVSGTLFKDFEAAESAFLFVASVLPKLSLEQVHIIRAILNFSCPPLDQDVTQIEVEIVTALLRALQEDASKFAPNTSPSSSLRDLYRVFKVTRAFME